MVNNICYDMLESQVKKWLSYFVLNGSKINVTGIVKRVKNEHFDELCVKPYGTGNNVVL